MNSPFPQTRLDRGRILLATLAVIFFWGTSLGYATTLTVGTGTPKLDGWCWLDWNAGCTTGLAVLSGAGLTLFPAHTAPPSSLELSLKLIQGRALIFLFESPSTTGKITFSVDGSVVRSIAPPRTGSWWVRLTDLPSAGILRLELDRYCDQLTITSVNYDCCSCGPCPDCWKYFWAGVVTGAIAALFLNWFAMR